MSETVMTSLFWSVSTLMKYRQETLIGLKRLLKQHVQANKLKPGSFCLSRQPKAIKIQKDIIIEKSKLKIFLGQCFFTASYQLFEILIDSLCLTSLKIKIFCLSMKQVYQYTQWTFPVLFYRCVLIWKTTRRAHQNTGVSLPSFCAYSLPTNTSKPEIIVCPSCTEHRTG